MKVQWIFVILLSLFVMKNFRRTCPSSEMLKGYMVIEWFGKPYSRPRIFPGNRKRTSCWCALPSPSAKKRSDHLLK